MPKITAALVKELREKTGAGMMDCKKALSANNSNIEESIDWLRTKGLAAATKKAGRLASEGLIGIAIENGVGALVEVNSETDFVARNEKFQEFVSRLAKLAISSDGDINKLKREQYSNDGSDSVEQKITEMVATVGENIQLRRIAVIKSGTGLLSSYIHNRQGDGLGKIGVLVSFQNEKNSPELEEFAKQIAMHIAATKPKSISRHDLDTAIIEREKNVLTQQAQETGKPDNIIDKMVEGRIRKFYEEICLLEQTFALDGETKIADVISNKSKSIGESLALAEFAFFVLGEGIEKKE